MPILDSMKSLVVLLANGISDYAFQPLAENGSYAFAAAFERAVQLPDCMGLIVTAAEDQCGKIEKVCEELSSEYPQAGKVRIVPVAENTAAAVFQAVKPFTAETDHVFFAWADAPFLDTAAAEQLYRQHCTYKAEYSFADGYPEGLLPQITAAGLIPILAELPYSAKQPLTRSFIFETVKNDINSYDLETMIAPDDVRSLRLAFYTDTKGAWMTCRLFTGITAQNYASYIYERREHLRPIPAYYGIEITASHPLHSLYRPELFSDSFTEECCMDLSRVRQIVDSIAAFSETAVISLSLYGEPLLHPHCADIIKHILSYPNLSVLIETSALAGQLEWYTAVADSVRAAPPRTNGKLPVYWVVFIDALSSKMYGTVHRLDDAEAERCLKQAVTAAEQLAELFPQAVWAQIIRMNENEPELEPFYRFWEQRKAQPLIQKYDHICGMLPDRRPADISPLHRHPCWHLKRDLSVCNDGTVPLCKQDCKQSAVLGNIFTDQLSTLWEKGQAYYQKHLHSDYQGLCEHCDEYYTYNF
ncbi:MAG: spiro-SPASM protein [Treponema sp.]